MYRSSYIGATYLIYHGHGIYLQNVSLHCVCACVHVCMCGGVYPKLYSMVYAYSRYSECSIPQIILCVIYILQVLRVEYTPNYTLWYMHTPGTPSAPIITKLRIVNLSSISVSWNPPEDTGHLEILEYCVSMHYIPRTVEPLYSQNTLK